jgi:spore cortex biosynthesis protein YabQ
MVTTFEAQLVSLILSVFAGLMVGFLFDLYRTINFFVRPLKAFLYLMDLLFWLITGGVVFAILLNADYAQLRAYTFMGMGLGIFIYFKLFSIYILKLYRGLFYFISKLFRLLFILIILPFKLFYNLIWGPLYFIKKILIKAGEASVGAVLSIFKKLSKIK